MTETIVRHPLPNRVDPFGALSASPARGLLMGNRGGRFHRQDGSLGDRRWASIHWIACVCDFKGRKRTVWGEGYTELFFLDEPTAFAAGHRPCFECRRREATAFRAAWGRGKAILPSVADMDTVLHDERLAGRRKRRHIFVTDDLPDGAVITQGARCFALRGSSLLPWDFGGYGTPIPRPQNRLAEVLTPPSILKVLARGYRPRWHPSAETAAHAKEVAGARGEG